MKAGVKVVRAEWLDEEAVPKVPGALTGCEGHHRPGRLVQEPTIAGAGRRCRRRTPRRPVPRRKAGIERGRRTENSGAKGIGSLRQSIVVRRDVCSVGIIEVREAGERGAESGSRVEGRRR